MRQAKLLEPIELELLRSVRGKRSAVKRDIYWQFVDRVPERTIARKLNGLIDSGYIKKNNYFRLTVKGSRALKKVQA